MVLQDVYCEVCGVECGKGYTIMNIKRCKPCHLNNLNNLKTKFVIRTSRNEKIDDFIQEMQLKVPVYLFEWIPYSQFSNVKEISKSDLTTLYSATWKNGPLR